MKATGAEVLAYGKRVDKDSDVVPDRVISEGDTIEGTEFGLEVLHTPGHAPNHLCFLLEEERVLFTGDTVLEGMYSVVSPSRGGDMRVYLATLARFEKMRLARLCPGHGDVIEEPRAVRPGLPGAPATTANARSSSRSKAGPVRIKDIVDPSTATASSIPSWWRPPAGRCTPSC